MEIEDFIIRSKIPNFEVVKKEVLDIIDTLPKMSYEDANDKISNTDYYYNVSQPYLTPLKEHIENHCEKIIKLNYYRHTNIQKVWFQQYEYGDRHLIHTHENCNIANVIFIELPNKESATKFIWKNNEYSIDAKEGEIISFPSMLSHYSPPNYGKRKTIISFNILA